MDEKEKDLIEFLKGVECFVGPYPWSIMFPTEGSIYIEARRLMGKYKISTLMDNQYPLERGSVNNA